jgi:hypothetical protein
VQESRQEVRQRDDTYDGYEPQHEEMNVRKACMGIISAGQVDCRRYPKGQSGQQRSEGKAIEPSGAGRLKQAGAKVDPRRFGD